MANYLKMRTIQTSGRACYEGRAKIDIGFMILGERMTMDGIVKKSADRVVVGRAKHRLGTHRVGLYLRQREHLNHEVHRENNNSTFDLRSGLLKGVLSIIGYQVAFLYWRFSSFNVHTVQNRKSPIIA